MLKAVKMKMTQIFREDRVVPVTPVRLLAEGEELPKIGDFVKIMGVSKGKGFQGVVKRHGFGGGPKTHGQKDRLRAPGSIGNTDAQHVYKGRRMAGRMGGDQITLKRVEVSGLAEEKKILFLKGALPGPTGKTILIEK